MLYITGALGGVFFSSVQGSGLGMLGARVLDLNEMYTDSIIYYYNEPALTTSNFTFLMFYVDMQIL